MNDQERTPAGLSLARVLLRSRQTTRPPRAALVGSIVVHLVLAATAVASTQIVPPEPPMSQFKAYRVELYSPPPQVEGPPEPPKETPKPAIVKQPRPPEPRARVAAKKPAPKAAETKTSTGNNRREQVKGRNARPGPVGGENLNVLQEGEEFPYPGYLENVITQINRYFRWTGAGNLEAEIGFYIRKDGTVSGLRVFSRSANFNFDIAAMAAVEHAGKSKTFGALPSEFPRDSLGVLFRFIPPNK
ncbi:MAG: TonB C-terminal domain-containing protein [Longimicrobiales bacterium]